MVLLIDANVILNFLCERNDHYLNESKELLKRCSEGKAHGFVAFHSLPTIWYVLRKWGDEERRRALRSICDIFSVCAASKEAVMDALENDAFADFEDCLQDKCAKEAGADYIVTCNVKDFKSSDIPALTPSEILTLLR